MGAGFDRWVKLPTLYPHWSVLKSNIRAVGVCDSAGRTQDPPRNTSDSKDEPEPKEAQDLTTTSGPETVGGPAPQGWSGPGPPCRVFTPNDPGLLNSHRRRN